MSRERFRRLSEPASDGRVDQLESERSSLVESGAASNGLHWTTRGTRARRARHRKQRGTLDAGHGAFSVIGTCGGLGAAPACFARPQRLPVTDVAFSVHAERAGSALLPGKWTQTSHNAQNTKAAANNLCIPARSRRSVRGSEGDTRCDGLNELTNRLPDERKREPVWRNAKPGHFPSEGGVRRSLASQRRSFSVSFGVRSQ